ncbi:MAG: SMC-Scp complex subunit ScpB [Gloeobacteraceae cyanobacterium ES-bin-316]|nr:SMC-Scp complex subunit ScpB [Ferruginibacter sp.]
MEIGTIIPHIEALVFASDKPLSVLELTEHVNNALGFIEDRASLDQVESAVEGIKEKYDSEFYAFELKQSGGGWQFLTKPAYHKTVALINGDKFIKKLSNAALETLAIIAYKQPITKSEIESIRGVNCDYAVQKLLEKDLVIISGRNEDAVGKPLIYNTSKSFMDYFGINSANDLPRIREVLMEEYEKATSVDDIMEEQSAFEQEAIPTLVTDNELNPVAEEVLMQEKNAVEKTEGEEIIEAENLGTETEVEEIPEGEFLEDEEAEMPEIDETLEESTEVSEGTEVEEAENVETGHPNGSEEKTEALEELPAAETTEDKKEEEA